MVEFLLICDLKFANKFDLLAFHFNFGSEYLVFCHTLYIRLSQMTKKLAEDKPNRHFEKDNSLR